MKWFGILFLSLGAMACAGPGRPPPTHLPATVTTGPPAPHDAPSAEPADAQAPAPTPTPASPDKRPPISLEQDPCLLADVDLAKVPERCRCFVGQGRGALDLVTERVARRQACEVGADSAAPSHLRVTGSAAFAKKGSAAAVTIVVENVGSVPVAVRLADPWRGTHPILLSAKDSQGRRVDEPAGRCDGPGHSDGVIASVSSSLRVVVLPPGGTARLASHWLPREAVYLRDVAGNDKSLAVLQAMSPCLIQPSGRPLAPGRYELSYDIGLAVPPVTVAVDLR